MNKRLTKQYTKNIRLDAPLGLLGVPPDLRYFHWNKEEKFLHRTAVKLNLTR